ncbi:uncharacterized protein [Triticum aestivum]|uniref:uncharacterized protein n=1 Tax=Triticum aestivum TaxID=4565 RepID=UPI001D0058E6|nr:uncharacterized protein LOC123065511 [Triticum aestivum]
MSRPGPHWSSLAKLMPSYRALTAVSVGNGRTTAFWLDSWLPGGALSIQMSSLFSHVTSPDVSVAHVAQHGLDGGLVPRLNRAGARERGLLLPIVQSLVLSEEADARALRPGCAKGTDLSSVGVYQLCHFGGVGAPFANFIWTSYAPSRVRFFAWLLVQARIHTRDVLLRKHIVEVAEAGCPICSAPLKTADHLIFTCPFAQQFRASVGATPTVSTVKLLHLMSPPGLVPPRTGPAFLLLCCWQLWKHRNAVVFQNMPPSLPRLLQLCREDAVPHPPPYYPQGRCRCVDSVPSRLVLHPPPLLPPSLLVKKKLYM